MLPTESFLMSSNVSSSTSMVSDYHSLTFASLGHSSVPITVDRHEISLDDFSICSTHDKNHKQVSSLQASSLLPVSLHYIHLELWNHLNPGHSIFYTLFLTVHSNLESGIFLFPVLCLFWNRKPNNTIWHQPSTNHQPYRNRCKVKMETCPPFY